MKYIKIPLTEKMENDYRECAEMADNGEEKDCSGCSLVLCQDLVQIKMRSSAC